MRLYLSSFRLGLYPAELVRLAGGAGARTAVILNAMDSLGSSRDAHCEREFVDLRGIGLNAEELDLREYVGEPDRLRERLEHVQLIWARGGNSFVLRRAMVAADFDDVAKPLIESGAVAYAGYSAGVCVATPTLKGIELCDDAIVLADGSDAAVPWDGMGLVDYSVAPHYQSNHPESDDIEQVVAYFKNEGMPYRTLRDGEVITVEDGIETLLSFPA